MSKGVTVYKIMAEVLKEQVDMGLAKWKMRVRIGESRKVVTYYGKDVV